MKHTHVLDNGDNVKVLVGNTFIEIHEKFDRNGFPVVNIYPFDEEKGAPAVVYTRTGTTYVPNVVINEGAMPK